MNSNDTLPQHLDPLVTRALASIDREVQRSKDALITAYRHAKIDTRQAAKRRRPVRTARCEDCGEVYSAPVDGDLSSDGLSRFTVGYLLDAHVCHGAKWRVTPSDTTWF